MKSYVPAVSCQTLIFIFIVLLHAHTIVGSLTANCQLNEVWVCNFMLKLLLSIGHFWRAFAEVADNFPHQKLFFEIFCLLFENFLYEKLIER